MNAHASTSVHRPYTIAVITHAGEVTKSVRQVLSHISGYGEYDLHYHMVSFDTAVSTARECLSRGCEAILSHGGTGAVIAQALGHSVALIDRTDMDIIHTLRRIRHLAPVIALATHNVEFHDIATIEELLKLRICHIQYSDGEEMFQKVEEAYAKGVRVLVGGGPSSIRMNALGGAGFVIELDPNNIIRAQMQAAAICRQKRHEEMRRQELDNIFTYVRDGIVCLNSAEELLFANAKALQMLKISPNNPGKMLAIHYKSLGLLRTLSTQQPIHDDIVNIESEMFVVNCFPLRLTPDVFGAVALFNSVSTIQNINRKIGKNIYSSGFQAAAGLGDIQGKSPAIGRLKAQIRRVAQVEAAVLIQGETGTGKELVANAIHQESQRKRGPFVAVNCAAIAETLMESELFGYEGGSFTGARSGGKMGLFEMAQGGTLFLDEIGEISHALQLRLLRVLETKKLIRVGGGSLIPVNVRIISATNKNLLRKAQQGVFRMDLYYRIATLSTLVPPLRDRLEDIPLLLEGILSQYGKPMSVFSRGILGSLQKHPWHGNVRELLSAAERYVLQLEGNQPDEALFHEIFSEYLAGAGGHPPLSGLPATTGQHSLKEMLHAIRVSIAEKTLAECGGDKEKTAKRLGLSTTSLWRILQDGTPRL